MQPASNVTDKESLTIPQRWAGMYTVILILLLMAFFAYHQWINTGFFTDKFGWAEMLALYGPIVVSFGPPIQRLVQGQRNPARPLEAATDISLAAGSIWLWNQFPFDFTHLADPFPAAMRFAFAWLTNDTGRFILLLQIAIGFISGLAIIVSYVREKRTQHHAG